MIRTIHNFFEMENLFQKLNSRISPNLDMSNRDIYNSIYIYY